MIVPLKKRKHSMVMTTPYKKRKQGDYQRGREMSRTPKQELKAFDVAQTVQTFNTAGTFQLLNCPVNGPEIYQRVGRKIYMKSVHIRGFIYFSATTIQDLCRIIVFYDAQPNAAAANLAALLQDSNAGAATTGLSEINLANRARFKILRDFQLQTPSCSFAAGVITNVAAQDQKPQSLSIDMFIKLKGLETEFNGTNGGTIADITSGSLYVACISQSDNVKQLYYTSRLRYYD